MRRVLFHRDFQGYTGGHGKLWDYFNHVRRCPGYEPRLYGSPATLQHPASPWHAVPDAHIGVWQPEVADLLFLGGMDWTVVPDGLEERVPVINLVQHVRHADPALPLHAFLSRRAHRICVSHAVAEAILGTGRVNGPVSVIPAGLDLAALRAAVAGAVRDADVLIAGLKNPPMALELAKVLRERGFRVDVVIEGISRTAYVQRLASADVAVFLPSPTEGFYLPALEAMALGTAVVVPDCIGNREYCVAEENCLMPDYSLPALADAVSRLLSEPSLRGRCVNAGRAVSGDFELEREFLAFRELLAGVEGCR